MGREAEKLFVYFEQGPEPLQAEWWCWIAVDEKKDYPIGLTRGIVFVTVFEYEENADNPEALKEVFAVRSKLEREAVEAITRARFDFDGPVSEVAEEPFWLKEVNEFIFTGKVPEWGKNARHLYRPVDK